MIKRLKIQNFKCFEEAELHFGPFNVLVGPNDSGKTTILDALVYLGRMTRQTPPSLGAELPADGPEPVDLVVRDRNRSLQVRFEMDGRMGTHDFSHALVLQPGPDETSYPLRIEEALTIAGHPWITRRKEPKDLFLLTPPGAEASSLFQPGGQADTVLRVYGRSPEPALSPLRALAAAYAGLAIQRFEPHSLRAILPDALRPLFLRDKARLQRIEEELRRLIPSVDEISLLPPQGTELLFKLASGAEIPARLASDGALLLLAFLVAVHQPTPPPALLIEEPENGLHPHRVGEVVRILRGMASEGGRQVILTTHSPILLNYVEPEEVFVCHRAKNGWAQVVPMTKAKEIDDLLQDFDLGELWYNVGEKRLLPDAG